MILVTGASGCLGVNLTQALLDNGEQVAAFLLPQDKAPALAHLGTRVERRHGDVLDPASLQSAMRGIDTVYHAAGIASPCLAAEAYMRDVNVTGTRHVLQVARQAGVRRVLHISSIAAVGYPDGISDETSAYNGDEIAFAYMHTKRAAEQEVQVAVAQGLDALSVCPAAVIAPWCDRQHGWGRIMLDVAKRRLAFCPPGGIAYIGSRDLAAGMIAAMQHGHKGERYLLASGNTSYRNLIDCFAAAASVSPPKWTAPRRLLRAAVSLLRAVEPLSRRCMPHARISSGVIDLLWRQKHYRTDKALCELGFTPTQSMQDAVTETWSWLATHQ